MTRMRRLQRPAAASLAALVACLGLAGDASAFSRKVQRACQSDYKRLCPHYKAASPQLRACMEAKSGEISWTCISALIDDGAIDRRRASR